MVNSDIFTPSNHLDIFDIFIWSKFVEFRDSDPFLFSRLLLSHVIEIGTSEEPMSTWLKL